MAQYVVLGDFHVPFHDERAIQKVLKYVDYAKPKHIILNGDICDMYSVSKYEKDPDRVSSLQDEVDQTIELLADIRRCAPRAEVIWLEGNHEVRLRRFLNTSASELSSLRSLEIPSLFELSKLKVKYIEARYRGAYTNIGGSIIVGHHDVCRKWSSESVRALVMSGFGNYIHGHSHRLGAFFHRANGVQYFGYEGGCLCSLEPHYIDDCDWQQGFIVCNIDSRGNSHVELVHIKDDYSFYTSGRLFR